LAVKKFKSYKAISGLFLLTEKIVILIRKIKIIILFINLGKNSGILRIKKGKRRIVV